MEAELVRLATYSSFPIRVSRLYPSRLSRLGFYYNSATSCIVCHRCHFSTDLKAVDDERDLDQRHYQQSPICRSETDSPTETRDVTASRDLPTRHADSLPRATTSSPLTETSE